MFALPKPAVAVRTDGLRVVVAMAALMWVVEAIDAIDGHRLDGEGIRPRRLSGLLGVVVGPFLHANLGHLIANTLPFLVLGLTIALEGAIRVLAVTGMVALAAGLGTWLVASDATVTVGASGIVFGYATYLICRGLFNRRPGQVAIGVVVVIVFGGALLGSLIPQAGISWQDHLFGAIGGVIAARVLVDRRRGRATAAAGSSV